MSSPTDSFIIANHESWGPKAHGYDVAINPSEEDFNALAYTNALVVDIETDEGSKLAGLGVYGGGSTCSFFTSIPGWLNDQLSSRPLVGQNIKFDAHFLRSIGVNVQSSQLYFDTQLASYVADSSRDSHGLKAQAKEVLGISYPTYREIVGTGKKKLTLDKQPVEIVAAYNAMDCLCTYKLWQHYEATLTPSEAQYLETLEHPVTRALFDMEERGVNVNASYLRDLRVRFTAEAERLASRLRVWAGVDINLNSPVQIKDTLLGRNGLKVAGTSREVLEKLGDIPLVATLLRYRELTKLLGTYVEPMIERAGERNEYRLHGTFNQAVTITGRLSSSDPNLQNIPTRTDTGLLLREAFTAPDGYRLVDADYSQIEPRIMAHLSQDPAMIEIFKSGKDFYDGMAELIKRPRRMLKTFAMAKNYGAGNRKIAEVLKIKHWEAEDINRDYEKTFARFFEWKALQEARAAKFGFVTTMMGRRINVAFDNLNMAVPYIVQGSAAEVMKQAILNCVKAGYQPILSVHDELVFECDQSEASRDAEVIKGLMENAATLSLPLEVEPGIGKTWAQAKG